MKKIVLFSLALLFSYMSLAQTIDHSNLYHKDTAKGFRGVGMIGHMLINATDVDNVYIPSWGLDVEYWFNHKWGVGLHNDVEIETFIVRNENNEEIERKNPLVLTLDALYHVGNGFVFTLGPGIEIEQEKSFFLMRFGLEYETDINDSFYLMPALFMDQRLDGYHTWNLGLGVGFKR